MTKRELVVRIAGESRTDKTTELSQAQVLWVVQKTLDLITDGLVRGEHFEFREFGVFEIQTRKARVGRNPNKPTDTVVIPVRRVVKFKPGKVMKARVLSAAASPQSA